MSKKSEDFFRIMLDFFPSADSEYRKSIDYYGNVLETIIIENIFMPKIIKLVIENRDIKLIKSIFGYFEEVSNCEDDHLISVFSTTVLEILGNDKSVLEVSQKYMGPKTMQLQINAERGLGRN